MAVAKLTQSKKGLMFITDGGTIYMMPVSMMRKLLDGGQPNGYFVLTRMSGMVSPERFPKSPVYGADPDDDAARGLKPKNDIMSVKKEVIDDKRYEDI